jgi:acetolactate synthase-1/2/3 large subunit
MGSDPRGTLSTTPLADYLVERLRAAGTRTLFGLPGGGGNLDLIETAGRLGLPFVLTATESGSAIAAIAQAEITGAPGACITTLGPGAASVVNGVACAMLDRARLLVITDSYAAAGAAFAHQRVDHRALLAPVTKWSGSLAPADAFNNVDDAFDRLAELPPGPVHLDCPADAQEAIETGGFRAQSRETIETLNHPEVTRLLTSARKPLMIVGLGARGADDVAAIRSLCDSRRVPALVTYKAKGVVPDGHPWFGGIFTHGAIERAIVEASDLLIGVGFDPVEILPRPWTYRQPIVSIAHWQMTRDHVPFFAQEVGRIDPPLSLIAERVKPSEWDHEWIRAKVDAARTAVVEAGAPSNATAQTAQLLTPHQVVTAAAHRFAGTARVTVDAGAHMFPATILWSASEPNELLISNGLSTMGFALPAAIGAGLLDRDRRVVALTGDGGLLICMGELATVARERLNIVIIVFNDSSLSLIEIKQQARRLPPAGVALGEIDWTGIAKGFGLAAWKATTKDELDHALDAAAQSDGPSLIDVKVDRSGYAATLKALRG